MTKDALVLIGREGTHAPETLRTHASRLERRGAVDAAHAVTYAEEPARELRAEFEALQADRCFVVPATVAHSRETTDVLPGAIPALPGTVRYCEPIGRSPVLTRLIVERAGELVAPDDDATLVLVSQGSSSQPYNRQTTEYHAARIADESAYADVVTCYLLQNPAVECVRYNVSTSTAVAVPLFLTANETTESRIPAKLELGRGGIAYADPLGDHPLVTDAIQGELDRQRAFAAEESSGPASFEETLVQNHRSLATDGEGVVR
ncbi:CbiX/SirB N-terminal domain-containing protein [Halorientalis brevis]|uniref:CbiX/SirB N-terminal domain-containing protein n=1 Tax=Halorientalis brevis TaxID=1126241 RepID=A0ABD6CFW9_9EURY|nr:CbiX/SirB N-terminal domain-containing protein [Halorientalis brevis]